VPSVIYANTARVVCHQTFYGEEAVNVFHVRHAEVSPLSAPEMTAIASNFVIFYNALSSAAAPNRGINNLRHPRATLDMVRVYDLSVVPNPPPLEHPASSAGTAAETKVPIEVCATVTLVTAVGTRRGRGRVYLGPLGDGGMAISNATDAPRLALTSLYGPAFDDLNARLQAEPLLANARLAVLSTADAVSREVLSVRTDARPDTQRRRDLSASFGPVTSTVIFP